MSELLRKLSRLYGNGTVTPDMFGRRDALPTEVAALIQRGLVDDSATFSEVEPLFPPTLADIDEKGDNVTKP